MIWILWTISICLSIPTSYGEIACPPSNTSVDAPPAFSVPMKTELDVVDGRTSTLLCCISGVSKILWYFKFNRSIENWQLIIGKNTAYYEFSDSHDSLTLLQPKSYGDSGIYKCIGYKSPDNFISGETEVTVETRKEKDFELVGNSNIEFRKYSSDSNRELFCLVRAYKKDPCIFIWNKLDNNRNKSIISGSSLTANRTNASLIEGYNGYSTLHWTKARDNYRIYNFTLRLLRMDSNQEGYYMCQIISNTRKSPFTFTFYLEMIRININILFIGIGSSLILILILAYIFKYDIKIILKQIIRKFIYRRKYSGKYNFFFIYNFDHDTEYQFIYQIVKEIESRGFSTYFYHRDQTYGKDTIEDIICTVHHADMVVIWTTPNIWKNSVCSMCLKILIEKFKHLKRIYIMKMNKKMSLRDCNNKVVLVDTRSCISSTTFIWNKKNNKISKKAKYSEIWFWHHFISWLISCLPLKVAPN